MLAVNAIVSRPLVRPPVRVLACGVLLALLVSAAGAQAQSTPTQLAEANRSAMEAYNNLDVEQAKAVLEKAVANAEKSGLRGGPLARTYANLGVVLVGLGDKSAAIAQFKRALKEDAKIEPDPLVATPEVSAAFAEAKKSGAPSERAGRARASAPVARRSVDGNLDHAPVAEQLAQTAVPVFVSKTGELNGATLKLFYRSLGMQKPRSAEMQETDDGFTYLIPCADVFEPVVEYFIVALDQSGAQVGNAGTPAAPVQVPVVSERTQPAPSLPGQVPPTQCAAAGDDTDAPVATGPRGGGSAGLGETCSRDDDCGDGLSCEDNFCSMSERKDASEESSSSWRRVFLELNFGVGATYVGSGRAPDHSPPRELRNAVADGARDADGVLDPAAAQSALEREGWSCAAAATEDDALSLTRCTVAVKPGGFVAVPVVHFAAGYYVTQRLALALTGRIQFARGLGTLAGTLLGLRGEFLATRPVDKGFRLSLLAGVALGQMQARPPAEGDRRGPYATHAGLGADGVAGMGVAATAGLRAVYRFMPNLGFSFMPAMHLGLPNALFDIDVTAGAEVAF